MYKKIINDFSGIKLKKSNDNDYDPNELYRYSLIIGVERPRVSNLRFVLTLNDKKHIQIFDYDKTKNASNSYKITSDYNPESLENIFK